MYQPLNAIINRQQYLHRAPRIRLDLSSKSAYDYAERCFINLHIGTMEMTGSAGGEGPVASTDGCSSRSRGSSRGVPKLHLRRVVEVCYLLVTIRVGLLQSV
ncbi:hypothetical protein G7K_2247-t1 [Saitoella complicata NRRL Y-17804]|uniref:Uncharacterized protein n=1 Tax=Saitoella complicata (strain BCRC 22490 / CBS 7301 / JCM 7358 / NBRC 10748 / NRRL Y-17804) TaxID=698492 RepID=A0A0E9NDY7_SAICN|nr:hypothetical protein G7K_2247-t1 [Saitoella complicata NRRL Y-17804]